MSGASHLNLVVTLGAQGNTYIVLNSYRQHVSNAEYDQTQAITTLAKAVHGVQAFRRPW